eukprot:g5335.t1
MEKQDDSAIGGAISRYFSRLTSVCPSLQSLDGFLVRQGSLKQVMQKNLADHQEEGATSSHGSFLPVVDLRAAEKGAAKEGRNVSSNDVGSREGEPQQAAWPNVPLVPAASELLYKGEEFEVQQLHIELPGSDGAFQRALHGRGIWSVDLPEDCKARVQMQI